MRSFNTSEPSAEPRAGGYARPPEAIATHPSHFVSLGVARVSTEHANACDARSACET